MKQYKPFVSFGVEALLLMTYPFLIFLCLFQALLGFARSTTGSWMNKRKPRLKNYQSAARLRCARLAGLVHKHVENRWNSVQSWNRSSAKAWRGKRSSWRSCRPGLCALQTRCRRGVCRWLNVPCVRNQHSKTWRWSCMCNSVQTWEAKPQKHVCAAQTHPKRPCYSTW